MCLLDCSVWAIWWTASFCRAMWRPLIYCYDHVNSRCSHVSIRLFGHNVQFRFGGSLAIRCFYNVCPYIGCIRVLVIVLSACLRCLGMSKSDLRGCGLFHCWIIIYLHMRNWIWLLLVPFSNVLYLCMVVGVGWHNHVIMLGHHSTNMVWCGWCVCMVLWWIFPCLCLHLPIWIWFLFFPMSPLAIFDSWKTWITSQTLQAKQFDNSSWSWPSIGILAQQGLTQIQIHLLELESLRLSSSPKY